MVEDVEELRTELDAHSFPNLGSLEDGEIEVVDSRPAKSRVNTRFGTGTVIRWGHEASGIKPIRDVAAASFLVATRNHIGSNVADANVGLFQRGRAGVTDLQREAALERRDAIDAPPGNRAVEESREVACEHLSVAKGKIEDVTDHEALGNILRRK